MSPGTGPQILPNRLQGNRLPTIRVQTLGGLAVFDGARPLGGNAQQPRRLALLAVLARAADRGVSRDRLASLLWEEVEEERARRSLNQALYALRQEFGSEDAILGTRDLRLNPEILAVDLDAFETARASGAFEEAARLYGGPFLGDFHLPGVAAFARWAEAERAQLQADYRAVLEATAAAVARRDDRPGAVYWWRRLAALDPADTAATQGLMRALARAGDAAGAIRQAEIFQQLRRDEFELPPDPAVAALAEEIRRAPEAPRPAPPPAPRAAVAAPPGSPPAAPTVPVPPASPPPGARRWRGTLVAMTVLALVAVVLIWRPWSAPRPLDATRLAVLPFENEGDSADGYFTDGVTDELRGRLTSIPGLEVVASPSSNGYRQSTRPLAEIAEELGVGWLLIGRVRWQKGSGGVSRVQVRPELVRIGPGSVPTTRWQQPFDAALTDVFAVQGDIAAQVAGALDVVLGDSARQTLARKPTENLAAYDEFLKGEAASQGMKADQAGLRRAIAYYQRAVALDSTFAAAWAQLSRARSSLYSNGVPDAALGRSARDAAERARRLGPDAPLTALALGDYHGGVNPIDNVQARADYEHGLQAAPSNVDLLSAAASMEASLGRWDSAAVKLVRAARLDPRSVTVQRRLATVHLFLRRYAVAESAANRAVALAPTYPGLVSLQVMIALAQGDRDSAQALIRHAATQIDAGVLLPFFASYQDLYWVLDDAQQRAVLAAGVDAFDGDAAAHALVQMQLWFLRGDSARSRTYADSARLALVTQLRGAPEDAQRHALLGLALAYLGRRDEAIREGRRGAAMLPVAEDGYAGPYIQLQLARIYLVLGERDQALDQLASLLAIPYYLSAGWLRVDPTFAPLRTESRFRQLTG